MSTYTFSGTESYSESDVKAVMQNTYEDIIGFANRQIISYAHAESWIEDLTYILNQKVVKFFEIQINNASGTKFMSYKYTVDNYGYLSTGTASGGINYFAIPNGCSATLYVDLDFSKTNATLVNDNLRKRGWGTGSALQGTETQDRNYVSNNLRLQRSIITK
ncbi:hypothetical protein L1276_002584 [Flavobacterium sp. HSC-32F16]|uniref:HORMA-1 domain-containing protein n=1 Tax=Flavobacterium sp. HSC-32F16 TaxID=2910964 RepID=UPI0020A51B1B|nr:hypothetical protein [Flavobacterium sp. HSC-32F16]MCP2027427.1 hypothetical protein [Flavobacterium sp. HSC-32F16]